jgi:hypothetical protein
METHVTIVWCINIKYLSKLGMEWLRCSHDCKVFTWHMVLGATWLQSMDLQSLIAHNLYTRERAEPDTVCGVCMTIGSI